MDIRERYAFLYNAADCTIERLLKQEEDDTHISIKTLKKLQECINIFNLLNDLEYRHTQAPQPEAATRQQS